MNFRIGQLVVFTVEGALNFPGVKAPIYGTGAKQVYNIIEKHPERGTYDVQYKDPFNHEGFVINGVKEEFLMKDGPDGTVVCSHCLEWKSIYSFNIIYGEHGEREIICKDCANEVGYEVCPQCNTLFQEGVMETHELEGMLFCQRCLPGCHNCGEPAQLQDPATGRWLCEGCYSEMNSIEYIKPYNFKPIFTKFGQTDNNRFFGMEIEIDGGGEYNDNWRALKQKFPDNFVYAMHDGSLNEGFEIATQPATLEYLYGIDWEAFRKKCVDMGYRSHNTSTCGLHVHVDVNAFGLVSDEQDLRIGRILYFFSRFKPHLLRFSRRSQASMDRWAMIEPISSDDERYIIDKVKMLKYEDKYRAINLNHHQSVEFRIFRGTLNPKTIKATLQFVDALIDIAVTCSLSDIQTKDWEYFAEVFFTKIELNEYLELHKINSNNIPETVIVPPPQADVEIHPSTDAFLQDCVNLMYDHHSDAYAYLTSASNYDDFINKLVEEYNTASNNGGSRDIGAFLEVVAELSRNGVPPNQSPLPSQTYFRNVIGYLQNLESHISFLTEEAVSSPSFPESLRNAYTRRLYTLFTGAHFPRQEEQGSTQITYTATPQNVTSDPFYSF